MKIFKKQRSLHSHNQSIRIPLLLVVQQRVQSPTNVSVAAGHELGEASAVVAESHVHHPNDAQVDVRHGMVHDGCLDAGAGTAAAAGGLCAGRARVETQLVLNVLLQLLGQLIVALGLGRGLCGRGHCGLGRCRGHRLFARRHLRRLVVLLLLQRTTFRHTFPGNHHPFSV